MAAPLPSPARAAHTSNHGRPTSILDLLGVAVRQTGQLPVTPDRDWLLEVATSLQTTLDVEALLMLFSQHARRVVPHDAVTYTNARHGLHVQQGEPAEHSVSYDLVLLGHDLGQLGFTRSEPFAGAETLALENILCNLMHPLRNALMYREALSAAARDPLTGLNNRFSLDTVLDREIELARRHGTGLSLLMVDADHFKRINDEHGHLVGDAALRVLAGCITRCARDSDMVFRYGGEEFVVVLSNTRLAGAGHLAERIRRTVTEAALTVDDIELPLTVSVGVGELGEGESREALLVRSDEALYRAKRNGRNRVEVAPPSTAPAAKPDAQGVHRRAGQAS